MSGNYRKRNNLAFYIPCASRSLNLAGVHSASINTEMKLLFETVESIFNFFSRSTNRWTILMKTFKGSLKGHYRPGKTIKFSYFIYRKLSCCRSWFWWCYWWICGYQIEKSTFVILKNFLYFCTMFFHVNYLVF